ncbi:MAG: hypothetical protein ABIO61_09200 [Thermomonas sp.]
MSELESPHQLSRHTTPTWEVELLISGVAVFAMLQLPGWLDDGFFSIQPRLDSKWYQLALLVYFYSKSVAVILAATFVIHLLLRARWIALVGMHSVYPGGVRWEKMRMGPVQRELTERSHLSMETIIERADNLATTIFAMGVAMALTIVTLTGLLAFVFTATNGLIWLSGWKDDFGQFPLLIIAMIFLSIAVVTNLDRRYGGRWLKGGLMYRLTSTTYMLISRAGLGRSNNRIMALLSSNSGDWLMLAIPILVVGGAVSGVMLAYSGMRDVTKLGSYSLFPAADGATLDSANYNDSRDPARDPAVPFVQSMVVTGPYLKLVVPYEPRRDGPALRRDCPVSGKTSSERNASLLTCLGNLHPVSIDDRPIANQRYEPASDPRTDRPALLTMIDIRLLAQGRHELRVGRAPALTPSSAEKDAAASSNTDRYIIPFWR